MSQKITNLSTRQKWRSICFSQGSKKWNICFSNERMKKQKERIKKAKKKVKEKHPQTNPMKQPGRDVSPPMLNIHSLHLGSSQPYEIMYIAKFFLPYPSQPCTADSRPPCPPSGDSRQANTHIITQAFIITQPRQTSMYSRANSQSIPEKKKKKNHGVDNLFTMRRSCSSTG